VPALAGACSQFSAQSAAASDTDTGD
jgi:hypothetical protein